MSELTFADIGIEHNQLAQIEVMGILQEVYNNRVQFFTNGGGEERFIFRDFNARHAIREELRTRLNDLP